MRKNLSIWIMIILLILFLQSFWTTLFPEIFLGNLLLVFLLTLFSFLKQEWSVSWKILLVAGLLSDLFFIYPLGLSALIFLVLGFIFYYLKEKFLTFDGENFFYTLMLLVVSVTAASQLLLGLIFFIGDFFQMEAFQTSKNSIIFSNFFSNLLGSWVIFIFSYYFIKKLRPFLETNSSTLIIRR